jgi:hypothetical protein
MEEDNLIQSINMQPISPLQQTPVIIEKSKTKWILIMLGVLEFFLSLLFLLFVLPQIQFLYKSLNVSIPWTVYFSLVLFICMMITGFIQILIGLFSLDVKLGRNKTKAVIVLGLVLPILLILSTIIGGFIGNIAVNSMLNQELK